MFEAGAIMLKMKRVTNALKNEVGEFILRLNYNARQVLFSDLYRIISEPLVTIFIAAFIWRATESLLNVALYMMGRFIGLPLAFWLNGYVLRHIDIRTAFWCGSISAGIVTAAVIFFGGVISPLAFLAYGLLNGFGWGFYWANRNFLTLQETNDHERPYYVSIVHAAILLSNIVVPFVGGWLIVTGSYFGVYAPEHAYWVLFGLSLLLMLLSARAIAHVRFQSPIPDTIVHLRKSGLNARRLLNLSRGTVEIKFIIVLLILIYLGNEGILGTLTALVSLMAAISMYAYGRIKNGRRSRVMTLVMSGVFFMCALALAVLPVSIGVALYVLFSPIAIRFFAMLTEPFILSLSDNEAGNNPALRYMLTFDNELFINAGRIIGVVLVIALGVFASRDDALFWGPLVIGAMQLMLLIPFLYMTRVDQASTQAAS